MLLLLPVMTRVLPPGQLGLVSNAQLVTYILGAFASLGLHSAAMREYFGPEGGLGDPALARSLSIVAVLSSTGIALFAHVAGPGWIQLFGEDNYGWEMTIAVFVIVPTTVHVVSQNLLRAEDRPLPFTISVLLATLGGQLLGLSVAGLGDGEAVEYLAGFAIGFVVGGSFSAFSAGLRGRVIGWEEVSSGLRLGIPTIPHSLGIFMLQVGDRIVLTRERGLAEVGRYQVAYLIGSVGITLTMAFAGAWTPMIFRIGDAKQRWAALAATTEIVHRSIGLVASSLIVLSPVLLSIAAPASYDTEGLVFVISMVVPAAVAYVTFQAASMVLFQLRKTGQLGAVSITAAAVNLLINIPLVAYWGLSGAAFATTLSYAGWAVGVRRISSRFAEVEWRDGAMWQSVAMVVAAFALSALMGTSFVSLVVRVLVGVALFTVLLSEFRKLREA